MKKKQRKEIGIKFGKLLRNKMNINNHIKKHTKKENTYDNECPFCNEELRTEEQRKEMVTKGLLWSLGV